MGSLVFLYENEHYDLEEIEAFLKKSCGRLFDQIEPGMRVVLKPNWVRQGHWQDEMSWLPLITHPDVIAAVLRAVLHRLKGAGHILICDGPQTDSSFAKLISRYPVDQWRKECTAAGVELKVLDLREDEWITERETVVSRRKLPGDPLGSTEVNLIGEWSSFWGHRPSSKGYYGADYNIAETNAAHNGHDNLYRVSRSVMEADVFINLPKLKTHLKAGITANLKNLVGINTYKNYLPHYTLGCPDEGGDQFPGGEALQRLEASGGRWLKQYALGRPVLAKLFSYVKPLLGRLFGTKDVIRSGCWFGNDTLWRMILDLNKILFYAQPTGALDPARSLRPKVYIGVVDAIVAGEGDGPLKPDPLVLGKLFVGDDPVALDTVCATSMGFDYRLIPMIRMAWSLKTLPLTPLRPVDLWVRVKEEEMTLVAYADSIERVARPANGWSVLAQKSRVGDRR